MPAADANLLRVIADLQAENAALQAKIAFNMRVNDELQESKRLLDEAQRIARLGTWEFDPERQTIRWSDEVFRIAGMTPRPEAPTFKEYLKIVHPDDRAKLEASVNGLFSSGEGYELELRHLRPDGTYNYVITKAEPVFSEGKTVKIIGSVLDITERKHSEDVLRHAKEAADRANKMKSDFLSSVSHELRTPLTSIRGFASLIEREFSRSFMPLAGEDGGLAKKSARIQENLEIILKESDRLTRLINDVLDLAKIEAGRVEWHDAPVQAATLVRDAVNAAQGMFDQKPGVELKVEVQDGLPLFVGDADRMLQVLVNLLNNAVKFTDQGAVTVKAMLNPENLIQIDISDSGIGFPQEEAEAIFDKFQQAKHGDTLSDRPKGTGLGLAISREIVERHGGKIRAQSQPGKGSVFTVLLPPATETPAKTPRVAPCAVEEPQRAASEATPSGKDEKPRVLVVDDDIGVRDYLTQLLQEQGYAVVSAADGQAAMIAARKYRPDLITMDLAMPVMDGRTAITRLRADPVLQHIPIMVVSALPDWETAGGDLSMAKPLDESHFLKNIHLLLGKGEGAAAKKVRFLALYDLERNQAMAPGSFTAQCEVDFCTIDELPTRIQPGFQGMLLVPAGLLGKVDLSMLNAVPSLEAMVMPVPAATQNIQAGIITPTPPQPMAD